jgi:L-lactate dehydrogenase (cytochrome)
VKRPPWGPHATIGFKCLIFRGEKKVPVITNIADLRAIAKKRVAKAIFDYVDRGSYDEVTLKANSSDLDLLKFRQRVAINVDQRSTAVKMIGNDAAMPVAIAPTGLTGLNWANGEMLGARAA